MLKYHVYRFDGQEVVLDQELEFEESDTESLKKVRDLETVSYTHLTLPTICSV